MKDIERKVSVKKKVFIFNFYKCNLNDGGPSGVIAQNLLKHNSDIYELNPVLPEGLLLRDQLRKRFFPPQVHPFYHDWYIRCEKIYRMNRVATYPVVFFHDVFSLKCCERLIPRNQVVMLQSHCPELPHRELYGLSYVTEEMVAWARIAERDAFARADYLVFPNEGVLGIYAPLILPRSRIKYLVTGAKQVESVQRIPLDPTHTYLLFIGRRNHVKGFDIMIEAFRRSRKDNSNLHLVIIGNGNPVIEEGIIDVGFSSRPHDWINSCDFVVNCNRQSYFDLSILETLSIGTPLIMSTNHGHRVFADLAGYGIVPIGEPTVESLCAALVPHRLSNYLGEKLRNRNRLLFKERFSDVLYRRNLEQICKALLTTNVMARI